MSGGRCGAGTVWRWVVQTLIEAYGWRETMALFGIFEIVTVVPLAAIFLKAPPAEVHAIADAAARHGRSPAVLGWPAQLFFVPLALAALFFCGPIATPQGH